jgi:lactoylglutathione lyase
LNLKFLLAVLLGAALSSLAAPPSRPRITAVAHVALYVHDLDKSREFYKGLLGYQEPFSRTNDDGSIVLTFIKLNDRQYVELFPEKEAGGDRLNHISVETDDAAGMRTFLESRGVKVPDTVGKGRIGNLNFNIIDPDGHQVEIVQYLPDSWTMREQGKSMTDGRVSTRLRHVGIIVTNLNAAVKFYRDVLGFQETWRGSRPSTNQLSWVNLKVPEGEDYLEFMLYAEAPAPNQRGTQHHLCLEVPDIEQAKTAVEQRTSASHYSRPLEVRTGVNRKRQMNLYDPDGTRVELMEPKTVDRGRADIRVCRFTGLSSPVFRRATGMASQARLELVSRNRTFASRNEVSPEPAGWKACPA